MTTISIIAAVSLDGVIGNKGKIPWRLSSDLKRFRKLTVGHAVVMGRKTFESILEATGKILPERLNIVLTRSPSYRVPLDAEVANTLEEAFAEAEKWEEKAALENPAHQKEIFVIGGAEIYKLAMPHADRIYLTRVHDLTIIGDAYFPEDELALWVEIVTGEKYTKDEKNDCACSFHVLQKKQYVDLDNARLTEQREAMERILARDHCPFCPENLALEHKEPILREGKYWVLTKNQWPYKNTKTHLLIILKEHTETFSGIGPEAGREFFELLRWIEKEFAPVGGGVCMRFGDTAFSAGTVRHLHAQLIVPDRESESYEPVFFKIGSNK